MIEFILDDIITDDNVRERINIIVGKYESEGFSLKYYYCAVNEQYAGKYEINYDDMTVTIGLIKDVPGNEETIFHEFIHLEYYFLNSFIHIADKNSEDFDEFFTQINNVLHHSYVYNIVNEFLPNDFKTKIELNRHLYEARDSVKKGYEIPYFMNLTDYFLKLRIAKMSSSEISKPIQDIFLKARRISKELFKLEFNDEEKILKAYSSFTKTLNTLLAHDKKIPKYSIDKVSLWDNKKVE